MSAERLVALVTGVVQGVGFRYFVQRNARALGLAGHVRNMPRGGVEVVAEGPRRELEELLQLLREGPRSSVVKGVDVSWSEATGACSGFDVTF
jgi:acylphosphatase